MSPPRPPSRIENIDIPVFGVSWYGNPADGTSIVAYSGGGGSAKTGVRNKIVITHNGLERCEISTDDRTCLDVHIYQNPVSQSYWMVGTMGHSVVRYTLPTKGNDDNETRPTLQGRADVGVETEKVIVNAMADCLAVGCTDGTVHLFQISDDSNNFLPLGVCEGHTKTICSLSFALRGSLLVSSAKDGTARVWNYQTQTCLSVLSCTIPQDPSDPPPPKKKQQQQQVMVRGCAFGDLEGNVIYTVASTKRSSAYLFRWRRASQQSPPSGSDGDGGTYEYEQRTKCNAKPISAMSLSSDGTMLALGGVDGNVLLYNTETWKVMKKFPEVHDLPVTVIAARPYSTPLQGDEYEGVLMHAVTASGDMKFAFLTMERRGPRKAAAASSSSSVYSVVPSLSTLFWIALLSWVVYYIVQETNQKCHEEWIEQAFGSKFMECLHHTVLIAPATRPGILVPPH